MKKSNIYPLSSLQLYYIILYITGHYILKGLNKSSNVYTAAVTLAKHLLNKTIVFSYNNPKYISIKWYTLILLTANNAYQFFN